MPAAATALCVAIVLAIAGLSHEAEAGARSSRPLQTGQTTCWDRSGNQIACAGTGQDGELRRGEPRAYRDNLDGTITDLRVALTWEKLGDDGSIHDRDFLHDWDQAFAKIDDLNRPPCFAGFCDWRLPNRSELLTLVDLGKRNPAVSPYFDSCTSHCSAVRCSCTPSSYFWSSSTSAGNEDDGWAVDFGSGGAFLRTKISALRVRAVRGGR